jgi:integrase
MTSFRAILRLGEKIGWQTYRRAYSSLLRRMGVDIKVQQESMKHTISRTSMNVYADSYFGGYASNQLDDG